MVGDLLVCWRKGLTMTIQFTFSVRTLIFHFPRQFCLTEASLLTLLGLQCQCQVLSRCQLSPPPSTFSGRPGTGTINWIFFLNFSICGRVRQVLFYVSFCKNVKNVNKGTSCSRAHVSIYRVSSSEYSRITPPRQPTQRTRDTRAANKGSQRFHNHSHREGPN